MCFEMEVNGRKTHRSRILLLLWLIIRAGVARTAVRAMATGSVVFHPRTHHHHSGTEASTL